MKKYRSVNIVLKAVLFGDYFRCHVEQTYENARVEESIKWTL